MVGFSLDTQPNDTQHNFNIATQHNIHVMRSRCTEWRYTECRNAG
jgi:hypothetical protein